MTDRIQKVLDYLELELASDFVRKVIPALRLLNDSEINELFLRTHTEPMMGQEADDGMSVLLPLIERESDLRLRIQIVPEMGPVVAPELYTRGGGHDCPF